MLDYRMMQKGLPMTKSFWERVSHSKWMSENKARTGYVIWARPRGEEQWCQVRMPEPYRGTERQRDTLIHPPLYLSFLRDDAFTAVHSKMEHCRSFFSLAMPLHCCKREKKERGMVFFLSLVHQQNGSCKILGWQMGLEAWWDSVF